MNFVKVLIPLEGALKESPTGRAEKSTPLRGVKIL
jgi:hypothetical protein